MKRGSISALFLRARSHIFFLAYVGKRGFVPYLLFLIARPRLYGEYGKTLPVKSPNPGGRNGREGGVLIFVRGLNFGPPPYIPFFKKKGTHQPPSTTGARRLPGGARRLPGGARRLPGGCPEVPGGSQENREVEAFDENY